MLWLFSTANRESLRFLLLCLYCTRNLHYRTWVYFTGYITFIVIPIELGAFFTMTIESGYLMIIYICRARVSFCTAYGILIVLRNVSGILSQLGKL